MGVSAPEAVELAPVDLHPRGDAMQDPEAPLPAVHPRNRAAPRVSACSRKQCAGTAIALTLLGVAGGGAAAFFATRPASAGPSVVPGVPVIDINYRVELGDLAEMFFDEMARQGNLDNVRVLVAMESRWSDALPAVSDAVRGYESFQQLAGGHRTLGYFQEDVVHVHTNGTALDELNAELARGEPEAVEAFSTSLFDPRRSTAPARDALGVLREAMQNGSVRAAVMDLTDADRSPLTQALQTPGPVLIAANLFNLICEAAGNVSQIRCPGSETLQLPFANYWAPGRIEVPAYADLTPDRFAQLFDVIRRAREAGEPVMVVITTSTLLEADAGGYDPHDSYPETIRMLHELGFSIMRDVSASSAWRTDVATSEEFRPVVRQIQANLTA